MEGAEASAAAHPPAPPTSESQLRSEVPAAFICCISSEMMKDPVVTCDGQTYERTAIEVIRPYI